MSIYVPNDHKWPSCELELDGKVPAGVTWATVFEALLDGLEALRSRLLRWQVSGLSPSYAYGQKVPLNGRANNNWAEEIHAETESTFDGWYQTTNTGGERISFEVVPPHAMARPQSVHVLLEGNGHAGAAAHTTRPDADKLPVVKVWLTEEGEEPGLLGSTVDPSATKEAYDAPHVVSVEGLDHDPLSFGKRLQVQVRGEYGPNSQADSLLIREVVVIWDDDSGDAL